MLQTPRLEALLGMQIASVVMCPLFHMCIQRLDCLTGFVALEAMKESRPGSLRHKDRERSLCAERKMDAMNRLSRETSPYLLQHATNPVEWYTWGDEALGTARERDCPILLSIGYSSCHWCHVMAHESFEDAAIATIMNELYVNIKVDREERPDLDKAYQKAHQLLTRRSGGWPLTMFLDPHTLLPFFAGTYFPKTTRYQIPGFADVLHRVSEVYHNQKEEIQNHGRKLRQSLNTTFGAKDADQRSDIELLAAARNQLASQYDPVAGGFAAAPKFPSCMSLNRLLSHWAHSKQRGKTDVECLEMVTHTLTKMAQGGIYDHLGGGFCRYSTDANWIIPHFEKMLCDNGQLLDIYADSIRITGDRLFRNVVRETADWVVREMQHPEGGYFSALDADVEGEEGKSYLWTRQEIKALLTDDEYVVIETLYGLDKPSNFEGRWHLAQRDAWLLVIRRLHIEQEQAKKLLRSARAKLLARRMQRTQPLCDTKVIPSWNGLMIQGMCKAAFVLGNESWLHSAQRAADFVRTRCFDGERLSATWCSGRAQHRGYLDDYANMLAAMLALMETRWRAEDAEFAIVMAEGLLERFYDKEHGGFYFVEHEHGDLIFRPMPTADDALPSGNGVAAAMLHTLGHLLGDVRYLEAAEHTIHRTRPEIALSESAFCTLLTALEMHEFPQEQIIIQGPREKTQDWLTAARAEFAPCRRVFEIPCEQSTIRPAYLPKKTPPESREHVIAYLCRGTACSPPFTELAEFRKAVTA